MWITLLATIWTLSGAASKATKDAAAVSASSDAAGVAAIDDRDLFSGVVVV